jgi:hypothetical protein
LTICTRRTRRRCSCRVAAARSGASRADRGNPRFLAETVRLLAVEGPGDAPAIPESVREAIRRRLGHLGEDCNRLLVLAAVLGREFSLDALAGLAEVSADRLLDMLDEAILARVVVEVPATLGRGRPCRTSSPAPPSATAGGSPGNVPAPIRSSCR